MSVNGRAGGEGGRETACPSAASVEIDSFISSKCMFETVFDLSAGGIIMQKTLLRLSGREGGRERERERFELHTWKTVTFRSCLDP